MADQTPPPEMRRWQIPSPGAFTKKLALTTVPTPSASSPPLKDTQVLVRVAAAGLNPADYKLPNFGLVAKAALPFPKCPGMDFSGRAVAVGPALADEIHPGDLVMGRLDPLASAQGSLSEYVVAERDGVVVFHPPTPSSSSHSSGDAAAPAAAASTDALAQAAGVGTAALTAYQCIAPYVKPGDKVFINGGSGGTGTFGIQFAKALGCHVTVSCSTAKIPLCRSLGADDVVDYKTTDVVAALRERGRVFALVVDNVGNSPPNLYKASDDFLIAPGDAAADGEKRKTRGGRFKYVGGAISLAQVRSIVPSALLPGFLGGARHRFELFMTKNSLEDLARIAAWMAEGKVRTVVDSTFEFEEAVKAYERLAGGSSAGKIVVRVAKV